MIVFAGLLTLGVVLVLLCITVLVAKIFLWVIAPELLPILLDSLMEAIKSKSSEHTATFIGTML
jgi:hypothetical protein